MSCSTCFICGGMVLSGCTHACPSGTPIGTISNTPDARTYTPNPKLAAKQIAATARSLRAARERVRQLEQQLMELYAAESDERNRGGGK